MEYQKVFLYTKSCVAPLLPSFLFSSFYTKVIDVFILNLYMISRDLADVSDLWAEDGKKLIEGKFVLVFKKKED